MWGLWITDAVKNNEKCLSFADEKKDMFDGSYKQIGKMALDVLKNKMFNFENKIIM